MVARFMALLLVLMPAFVSAQPTAPATPAPASPSFAERMALTDQSLQGSWALRLDGSIIMRFDLERDGAGWKGGWAKPTHFATDGTRFGSLQLPAIERKSDQGQAIGEWAEITFNDPRPGEEPDVFRIRLIGRDKAEMIYVGSGLAPYVLERVASGALLGPFEDGRVYGGGGSRQAGAAVPTSAPPAPVPATGIPPRTLPPVQGPPATVGR
jgi:hypothetical protein